MEELIVLLDENLKPVGTAPKLASHHANTPLHLAFSCYLFNPDGQFLLTQRAASKKVWPGVWTNSFCGHPLPGESLEDAIQRRAAFELGITQTSVLLKILPDYCYKTPPYNGIIENEYCPVFLAVTRQEPTLNADEVDSYRWVDIAQLKNDIHRSPKMYSYWLKDQLPRLLDRPEIQKYL